MLRLVMGLGTRAVDRTEGDYPRIVNLSAPERSTLTESWAKHQYSQRYVDLMDYTTKSLSSRPLKDVTPYMDSWYKNWYWNTTAMPSGRSVSADSGVRFSLPTARTCPEYRIYRLYKISSSYIAAGLPISCRHRIHHQWN